MPRVKTPDGKVKMFPYNAKGEAAAKSYAKKSGGRITEKMGKKGKK